MEENYLTQKIIGAAMEVHRLIGPGLLESVYEDCMVLELAYQSISFERQKDVPLIYRGIKVGANLSIDLLVEGLVVVELKAVQQLLPVHEAQLLTYLRLTGLKVGLLLNFHVPVLRDGIKRMVNNFPDSAPPRLCGEGPSP